MRKTIDYIKTYTQHGGSWFHLKEMLIADGMSNSDAEHFISHYNKKLSIENSESALLVYETWLEGTSDIRVGNLIAMTELLDR